MLLCHNIKVANSAHFLPPMHTYTHTSMLVPICTHIWTNVRPQTCMHTYMHTGTHTFVNTHSHIYISKHNYV